MSSQLSTPVWISHRGYCQNATENTIEAFDHAVKLGFSYLETDLRISRDCHLILSHDPSLHRLGGSQTDLINMNLHEIRKIKLHKGAKVCLFEDFIERYKTCHWVFDIKPEAGEKTIKQFIKWVEKNKAQSLILSQAYFLFWNQKQEALLKRSLPGIRIFSRELQCWRAGLSVLLNVPFLGGISAGKTFALPPRVLRRNLYQKKLVSKYHQRGAQVIAFLPQSKQDAIDAIQSGFDYILTDKLFLPLEETSIEGLD